MLFQKLTESAALFGPAMVSDVTATVGMHGSASTWVFNVVRELVAAGGAELVTCYADTLATLPEGFEGKHLLVKSHHGSDELDEWLRERGARVILSIRDPRDASVSMAQRFKSPLQMTARWIGNDASRLQRLAKLGHPVLQYETRFFERPGVVGLLGQVLQRPVAEAVQAAIFNRYSTEAVRRHAASLDRLPAERVTMVGDFTMDKETQILNTHIGDGMIGKWRALPANVRAEMTRFFTPFLEQFGYPLA